MTLEQFGILVSIATALGGTLGVLLATNARFARVELKTDTIWEFLLRRGEAETIFKGLGTKNSPVRITDESSLQWFSDIKDNLTSLYQAMEKKSSDAEIMLAIERKYGDWIMHSVCLPHGIMEGACLFLALAVAKGSAEVHIKYSSDELKDRFHPPTNPV